MIYQYKEGRVTWHELENGREIVKSVPLPIDESLSLGERVIFAMLLHWLENETHARALVKATVKMFPKKLGRGEGGEFRIDVDELRDAVLLAFSRALDQVSETPRLEYMGGQRRDTLRIN